jgi:SulP family sulfate permease
MKRHWTLPIADLRHGKETSPGGLILQLLSQQEAFRRVPLEIPQTFHRRPAFLPLKCETREPGGKFRAGERRNRPEAWRPTGTRGFRQADATQAIVGRPAAPPAALFPPDAGTAMNAPLRSSARAQPTTAELFTPKLVTVLREGYGLTDLKADAIAGLTVAVVALPLCMAIAIAAGLPPERGLYTGIVGGFLISLFGGSRFQIGGPAGAFIVLVAAILEREGYDGLVMATLIAGVILIAIGALRLGTLIKYIPYPVTVGFTAGIAVIIVASQLRELTGLDLSREPAAFLPKLAAMWAARGTVSLTTIAVAAFSLAVILAVHRLRPTWPAFLIAVAAAAALVTGLHLDVATLGSRFGGVPDALPYPTLPAFAIEKLQPAVINGCAIALLGAIESLLSAVVADGMTGRRHRSNCELVAQGVGNIGSVLFGGMPATGLIARTATNIRAGARGPLAGIFHSLYLLLFVVFGARLIAYVPLAALGAVMTVVAWNMAERAEFWALLRSSRGDAVVLLLSFGLTVLVDLTTGIAVGVVLGAFLFLHRIAESVEIADGQEFVTEDQADFGPDRTHYDPAESGSADTMVYRIRGALFFGATGALSRVLDRIGSHPKVFVLDLSAVPLIDSTAANTLRGFVGKLNRGGTRVYVASARTPVRRTLINAGVRPPQVAFADSVESALQAWRRDGGNPPT